MRGVVDFLWRFCVGILVVSYGVESEFLLLNKGFSFCFVRGF